MLKRIISRAYRLFEGRRAINRYHIHPTAILYNSNNIVLSKTCLITEFVIVRAPIAKIEIDEYSQVGPFTTILTGELGVKVGKHVMIGPHCVIAAGNHEF